MKKPKNRSLGKSWYQIKNRINGETEIEIAIMENIGGWGIDAKAFRDDIKRIGADEPLHVHINSDGGDVIAGNEIFNILVEHNGHVRVSIGALAASIASVVAMAGDEISIAENGFLMIHNPWTMAMGDAKEMKKISDILDKLKDSIIMAYTSQTELPKDEIAALMDDETWMTSEEALENGFVDRIDKIDPDEDDDDEEDAKNFDLTKFRNSANFLSRLKMEHLKRIGDNTRKVSGDTGPAKVTLEDLQEANANPQPSDGGSEERHAVGSGKVIRNIIVMKDEVKPPAPPASPEAVEADIKKRADEMFKAELKRVQEIDDVVLAVRTRDKKDFGTLAARFKQEGKSANEFSRAIVSSDDFKKFEVVGSGVELIEPLDALRGSPGFAFVTSDGYKALADGVNKRGRGSIPQNTQRQIAVPYGIREYMNGAWRQFMNVAAEPSSSGLTSIEKLPGIVELGVRPLMVKDLIAPGATNNTTIRYIREVSFTNYATTVAEGAAKPEALFEYAEVDAPVRKIAAYTKVTDELFADYLAIASYINQRLPYMVERTEEDQILNGDGNSPNLTGILQTAGIQTEAKGGDTVADAIYKAMTKIRFTGFFEPDGLVMHPTDWQNLRLLKDGNNQYYGGGPFTGAYGASPLVQFDSIWGKPVAITPAISAGTALVGAFRLGAQYFQREGLTIEMTNSDQDDFIKNKMTIRCEERLALAVYRALAFCTVTGL